MFSIKNAMVKRKRVLSGLFWSDLNVHLKNGSSIQGLRNRSGALRFASQQPSGGEGRGGEGRGRGKSGRYLERGEAAREKTWLTVICLISLSALPKRQILIPWNS